MERQAAERAFQRFVSLNNADGAGLGLPIARGLARTHGGELTYDHGEFVLRLPLPEATEVPGVDAPRPLS